MTLRVGHPSKKGATDTSDARLDFRNRYVCNADGTPRAGVTSPVGAVLLSSTSSMNAAVAAFSGVTVRDGGVVEMANDGPVNVLLDAPPSSQSRIDVVYAKQNDSSSTVSAPDANDLPTFGVLKGTTSATPSARTDLPAGAVALGQVLIPSTATATNSSGVVITTTCPFTAAAGGKVPFRTLADLQAWTTAGPGQDARVFADSTSGNNGDYVWSGSTWIFLGATLADITTFGTGYVGLTGAHQPRVRRVGQQVFGYGAVQTTSGFTYGNILTVPPGFLPTSTDTRFIGCGVTSSGSVFELYMAAGVVQTAASYVTSAWSATGMTIPFVASWWLD